MPISVLCSCGKSLKVGEQHRGKKVKCPECGNALLVEESEAKTKSKTGVLAKAPGKKPVARHDDDDPDDEPEERKPIKLKKAKAKGSNMLLYAGGGCGVLLLLTCCLAGVVAGAWYFFFNTSEPDLIYVHEGTAGFVSIRVADAWKSQSTKDLLGKLPPDAKKEMDKELADMESKLGMKIEDLERVTVVLRSLDMKGMDKSFAVVFRTSKPMDSKKIIDAMVKEKKLKDKESKHDGATIHVLEGGPQSMALCFATDRVLVMTEKEATLKDVLTKSKKPAKNAALTRGIQMAASGKHQLVAAFEVTKTALDNVPADAWKQAPNLKDLNGVILAGTLTKDLALEAVLTFPSKDVALKAKGDVDALKTLAKAGMRAGNKVPPTLTKFLDSITIDQRGSEVVANAKLDLDFDGLGAMNPFGFALGGGGAGGGGGPMRTRNINNMKQIGLAMNSFHDANKALPNHAILDAKNGQPLLSWRVTLLPYLDEIPLYQQIRRNEPWNSQHNMQFWNKMPKVYELPGKEIPNMTYYQVFQGDQSAFPKRPGPPFNERGTVTLVSIMDGTSNTFGVVEAATPVNWMSPSDIPFQMGQQGLMNRVGNHWGNNTFHAGMLDGTVRTFRRNMPPLKLQALITRNGAEIINFAEVEAP